MLYFYIIIGYIIVMKKDYLQQPFELDRKEIMNVCPRGQHTVSFFELVYIISGTGVQTINGSEFSYKENDLFLLAPEDSHQFTFKKPTQLFFIRFNQVFFKNNEMTTVFFQRLELTFSNNTLQGAIIQNENENKVIKNLMESLWIEMDEKELYTLEVIELLVQSILTITARNLIQRTGLLINEKTENKTADIIQYVHGNIYSPEKLKGANIGKVFGISKTYVGRYFKNQTDRTLNEYVAQYKMKLIENRLKHSDMRMNEIADEFGFTDKSHLNRFFKKLKGVSPSVFRTIHYR